MFLLFYLILLQEISSHHVSRELASSCYFDLLDFEGVGNEQKVGKFYSDLGYSFSSSAVVYVNGRSTANEPSGESVVLLDGESSMVMNATNGFVGFTFYYSAFSQASVKVYSELDATGSLLVTQTLVAQSKNNCTGVNFCNWSLVTPAFNGAAKSLQFTYLSGGFFNVDDLEFELADTSCAPSNEPSTSPSSSASPSTSPSSMPSNEPSTSPNTSPEDDDACNRLFFILCK
jgi:hypothetical protein